ncbi:hypothetical protein B0H11DRAFT_1913054 [Mycena galericulata]|nr:hypothetical protein B0H11DRAFT_1913054 [Mycena galericulata]
MSAYMCKTAQGHLPGGAVFKAVKEVSTGGVGHDKMKTKWRGTDGKRKGREREAATRTPHDSAPHSRSRSPGTTAASPAGARPSVGAGTTLSPAQRASRPCAAMRCDLLPCPRSRVSQRWWWWWWLSSARDDGGRRGGGNAPPSMGNGGVKRWAGRDVWGCSSSDGSPGRYKSTHRAPTHTFVLECLELRRAGYRVRVVVVRDDHGVRRGIERPILRHWRDQLSARKAGSWIRGRRTQTRRPDQPRPRLSWSAASSAYEVHRVAYVEVEWYRGQRLRSDRRAHLDCLGKHMRISKDLRLAECAIRRDEDAEAARWKLLRVLCKKLKGQRSVHSDEGGKEETKKKIHKKEDEWMPTSTSGREKRGRVPISPWGLCLARGSDWDEDTARESKTQNKRSLTWRALMARRQRKVRGASGGVEGEERRR